MDSFPIEGLYIFQWVGNIDFLTNDDANANIVLEGGDSWTDQGDLIGQKVADILGDNRLDAIFCVAGGWAGGNAADKGLWIRF